MIVMNFPLFFSPPAVVLYFSFHLLLLLLLLLLPFGKGETADRKVDLPLPLADEPHAGGRFGEVRHAAVRCSNPS